MSVECTAGQIVDEQVVGCINGSGDAVHTDSPVVRVVVRDRLYNVLNRDEETRPTHNMNMFIERDLCFESTRDFIRSRAGGCPCGIIPLGRP
jgi:hypothetical protein